MKYNADYFIKFFEAIPDRKWCCNTYHDGAKHCAEGHLGRGRMGLTPLKSRIFRTMILDCFTAHPADINDASSFCHARFRKFKRPRTRILHALREAKKRGY